MHWIDNILELFFPPGNLPEIYQLSWKFSGFVCEFACLSLIARSYNSCISECISTNCLAVNQDQLIFIYIIKSYAKYTVNDKKRKKRQK